MNATNERISQALRHDECMLRFEAQSILFSDKPSRLGLSQVDLPKPHGSDIIVNVWRNQSFESVASLAAPYFVFGGLPVKYRMSEYDDSLSFVGHEEAAAELLWLDSNRFLEKISVDEWLEWLDGRVRFLRNISKAPIILATWLEDAMDRGQLQRLADAVPELYFAELSGACSSAGVKLIDNRSASMAGTPLSSGAQVISARLLACHWLPAALLPPIKAIAIDLDHTLHAGVLGEDGINGVRLSRAHVELQRLIKQLQQQGVFIALVSRNDSADVEALFAQRDDYPLRWENFSVTEVSWGDKAAAIGRIAQALNISADAILFVDDNPGELISVIQQVPQVHSLHASEDAHLTLQAIKFYPGLWRWKVKDDDIKRIRDVAANTTRLNIASEVADPADYFRSLRVTLTYQQKPERELSRLADLCKKTNQFNLAIRRLNEVEIADRLARSDADVASVQLADRLSDSGVIAVAIAERQGSRLIVDELCVSCRALGRKLEDDIILGMLSRMPIFQDCEEVAFRVQHGPRNEPALVWLMGLLGSDQLPPVGLHCVPSERIRSYSPTEGVSVS